MLLITVQLLPRTKFIGSLVGGVVSLLAVLLSTYILNLVLVEYVQLALLVYVGFRVEQAVGLTFNIF